MTLAHLFLLIIPTPVLSFFFGWMLGILGWDASFQLRYYASFPLAFFIAIVLAWPLSRLLRLRPIMAFAGPCPGCHTRPPGWHCLEFDGDRAMLECGTCGTPLELWLMRRPPGARLSTSIPSYALRWPEFLGIWHLVSPAPQPDTRGACKARRPPADG